MSIFKDERVIYYDQQEGLSLLLENKTRDEIYDELEKLNYILVESRDDKVGFGLRCVRVLSVLTYPLLFSTAGLKWLLTGDAHLDSWFKKLNINSKYFL